MTDIKTDKIELLNDDVAPAGFQLPSIIGMTKEVAIKTLEDNKRKWWITQEDGEDKVGTKEFLTGRVSLVIDKGIVSSYRLG